LIKKQITKAIKDAIVTGLGIVDEQLVSARDRMHESMRQANDAAENGGSTQSRLSSLGAVRLSLSTSDALMLMTNCRSSTVTPMTLTRKPLPSSRRWIQSLANLSSRLFRTRDTRFWRTVDILLDG